MGKAQKEHLRNGEVWDGALGKWVKKDGAKPPNIIERYSNTAKAVANGARVAALLQQGVQDSAFSIEDKCDLFIMMIGTRSVSVARKTLIESISAYCDDEVKNNLTAHEILDPYFAEFKFKWLLEKLKIPEDEVWEIAKKSGAK